MKEKEETSKFESGLKYVLRLKMEKGGGARTWIQVGGGYKVKVMTTHRDTELFMT